MEQFLDTLLFPLLSSAASAFLGWFFARRKQKAEAVASELETVEQAVRIWRELAQDLKKELSEQSVEIAHLRDEVSVLRKDNVRLLSELKAIKKTQNQS